MSELNWSGSIRIILYILPYFTKLFEYKVGEFLHLYFETVTFEATFKKLKLQSFCKQFSCKLSQVQSPQYYESIILMLSKLVWKTYQLTF